MTAINATAEALAINPKSVRRALRRLGYSQKLYAAMNKTTMVRTIKKSITKGGK